MTCLFLVSPLSAGAAPHPGSGPRPATVTLPEGFVGRESAIMTAVFPDWTSDGETSGRLVDDLPQHARLREVKRWASDTQVRLAVLVDTWTGVLCKEANCSPQPTVLALLQVRDGRLSLQAPPVVAGRHGGSVDTSLAPEQIRMAPDKTLVGTKEMTRVPGTKGTESHAMLRLFLLDKGELRSVFERSIQDTIPSSAVDCDATIAADVFGTAPYPIRVTESCRETGRASKELWRCDDAQYKLHGPASDARVADDFFKSKVDDPVR